jgi:cell division protein FtsB
MLRSLVGGDMTSPSPSVETQKFGGGHKLLVGIALTMVVGVVLVSLFSHRGLYQTYRLRHERLRLEQENSRLAAENERLARTIDRLQHDPVFIQDLIRKDLNYVKKNDIIFQFPPDKPVTGPALPATGNNAARLHAMSAQEVKKFRGVGDLPTKSFTTRDRRRD